MARGAHALQHHTPCDSLIAIETESQQCFSRSARRSFSYFGSATMTKVATRIARGEEKSYLTLDLPKATGICLLVRRE